MLILETNGKFKTNIRRVHFKKLEKEEQIKAKEIEGMK